MISQGAGGSTSSLQPRTTWWEERFLKGRWDEQRPLGMAAQSRVEKGQVSRARHELMSASLAPQNNETLGELRGRRPQERESTIPQEVRHCVPEHPPILDASKYAKCLQTAPTGNSFGPGGCINDVLKLCLEDTETLKLLTLAAEDFARTTGQREVSECFMLACMTALQKRWWRQGNRHRDEFSAIGRNDTRAPVCPGGGSNLRAFSICLFQFALSTRAAPIDVH